MLTDIFTLISGNQVWVFDKTEMRDGCWVAVFMQSSSCVGKARFLSKERLLDSVFGSTSHNFIESHKAVRGAA